MLAFTDAWKATPAAMGPTASLAWAFCHVHVHAGKSSSSEARAHGVFSAALAHERGTPLRRSLTAPPTGIPVKALGAMRVMAGFDAVVGTGYSVQQSGAAAHDAVRRALLSKTIDEELPSNSRVAYAAGSMRRRRDEHRMISCAHPFSHTTVKSDSLKARACRPTAGAWAGAAE